MDGRIIPFASKFPSGMKTLADYVHNRGLKFGCVHVCAYMWIVNVCCWPCRAFPACLSGLECSEAARTDAPCKCSPLSAGWMAYVWRPCMAGRCKLGFDAGFCGELVWGKVEGVHETCVAG